MKTILLTLLLSLAIQTTLWAQCETAEDVEVTLTLEIGNFGGDTRWTLVDDDTGEIYGANQWYGNNNTYVEKICVPVGANLTFTITCCFNNDGAYKLEMYGLVIVERAEFQLDEATSFVAIAPAAIDAILLNVDFQENILKQPQNITGTLRNAGTETITQFDLHWKINEDMPQTQTFSNIEIPPFSNYNFQLTEQWLPDLGTQEMHLWIDNVNGQMDEEVDNNSWQKTLTVANTLSERMVLVENFSNASCVNCATVDVAFNSIIGSNLYRLAPLNYHTNFPGYDLMYEQSKGTVDARVDFYTIQGTPHLVAEGGLFDDFTGRFQQTHIQSFSEKKASFNILSNEFLINDNEVVIDIYLKQQISQQMEDLKLFVAIVETQINYENAAEQPGNNGLQEFFYTVRDIFSNENKFDLESESEGGMQHFSFNYVIPEYVSAENLRSIVFIQDTSTKEIFQAYRGVEKLGMNRGSNVLLQGTIFGTIQIERQPPSCFAAEDGNIQVTNTSNETLVYQWSTGETSTTINNISGGDYTLTLTNSEGQNDVIQIHLPQPEGLDYTIESNPETDGASNGSAQIFINNPLEPLSYEWSDGQTGARAENLTAGTYTVTVTNVYQCQEVLSLTIEGSITNVIETVTSANISIYQNTTQTLNLHLETAKAEPFTLSIFDLSGKLVKTYSQTTTNSQIFDYQYDIRDLPSGIYVVHLHLGTQQFSQKLLHIAHE